METAFSLAGITVLALFWDWIGVGRLAAYYSDVDYEYWPLSRARLIGLGALLLMAWSLWALTGTNGPLWLLFPIAGLFLVWMTTALRDLNARRDVRGEASIRYSDEESGS